MKRTLSNTLRTLGRMMPNIPKIHAFPNRILYPIHRALRLPGGTSDVLGAKMILDPNECVDRWLWFMPHLYDRAELSFAMRHFPLNGIFIDAGANIGFWSLIIASHFPQAEIFSIEANPDTLELLQKNIELNGLKNITVVRYGLSDTQGELPLYCSDSGNRGGDSFIRKNCVRKINVPVLSLQDVCKKFDINSIDFLKMDIEGMEPKVLSAFFEKAPQLLWPIYICIEFVHSPDIMDMLVLHGYSKILQSRENTIFARLS